MSFTESSTGLNPALGGGDNVRDFVVTKPDGTLIKIQAISVVDAYDLANVQTVSALGEAATRDQLVLETLLQINERLGLMVELMTRALS